MGAAAGTTEEDVATVLAILAKCVKAIVERLDVHWPSSVRSGGEQINAHEEGECLNKEQWTIIGVGVALGLLLFHLVGGLRGDVADLRERMASVETTLQLVVQGLHIEVQGGSSE